MNRLIFTILVIAAMTFFDTESANILGISPLLISSHSNVIQPVFMELAKRGHNLTVISGIKIKNLPSNYKVIEVNSENILADVNFFDNLVPDISFLKSKYVWALMFELTKSTIEAPNVMNFIENDNSQFDLIICEEFNTSPYFMFAYKYNAPLVTFTTHGGAHYINNYMGNPMNLQYNPNMLLSSFGHLTLRERLENVIHTVFDLIMRDFYFMPKYNQIARDVFKHLPQPLPDLRNIERNTSLHLINTHFSIDTVRSYLPNMIEMGGIHLKKQKPLPEDLQKLMDNAKDGVIYFSMGSNLKSSQLTADKISAFIEAFSKLKQLLVLWKFEEENLPGKPENVVIRKWFPQNDVLAHPNVVLFITHGGLLSILESIHWGVPVVGIPIFGDQPVNLNKAKLFGYGEELIFSTLTAESVSKAIDKVLNDPSYREKAKDASMKINDTPVTVMENVVFWIEYVIRHNGAYHMKTPSTTMPWYEYYLLDVTAILLFGITVFLVVNYYNLKLIISFFLHLRTKKKNIGKKTSKRE